MYIGRNVRIGAAAVVGPFAVLDDGCQVGNSARIKGSVLLPSSYAGDRSSLSGALLCHGASVHRGASLFEGAAVGADSTNSSWTWTSSPWSTTAETTSTTS